MAKAKMGGSDVRAALAAGDETKALRIAAGFAQLGPQRDRIQKAWAAHQRPEFYRELGQNPESLIQDGVLALRERYCTEETPSS